MGIPVPGAGDTRESIESEMRSRAAAYTGVVSRGKSSRAMMTVPCQQGTRFRYKHTGHRCLVDVTFYA
jgi:hypothetical protein